MPSQSGVRGPGIFVQRARNPRNVYYIGRKFIAVTVHNIRASDRRGTPRQISRTHDMLRDESYGWVEVPGCPVWVTKYVGEEYRA